MNNKYSVTEFSLFPDKKMTVVNFDDVTLASWNTTPEELMEAFESKSDRMIFLDMGGQK